jgi:predicted transcriptional regulator
VAAPETDIRARILSAVSAKPGIHMLELKRTLDISLSGLTHHLRVLERQGAIVGLSDGYYHRYFLPSLVIPDESRRLNDTDRRLLAECRRPESLAIVLNLAVDGPLRHEDIAGRLKRSKGTTTYHLSRLVDAGIVRVVQDSTLGMYELVDSKRVLSILVTFAASLRDHVDGFARFWLSLGERKVRSP